MCEWARPLDSVPQLTLARSLARSDCLVKLLLIGDSGTGKSNLILRYADNAFCPHAISTIGVDFKLADRTIEGKRVKMQVWDTAGQERFRSIVRTFYRNAEGVCLVFDLTNKASFLALKEAWLDDVRKYATERVQLLLIGNKSDLADSREVTEEEAQAFAASIGSDYVETSAKTSEGVDEAFMRIASRLVRAAPKLVNHKGTGASYDVDLTRKGTSHADHPGKCACTIL